MARWRCQDCPATYGAWLSGCPRCRSRKELTLALNQCADCTTAFAVGLPRCPHCRSTNYAEQGAPVPKITVHGGASNAATTFGGDWSADPEPTTAVAVADPPAADEANPEEESSPGSSSSPSSETPPTEPEPSKPPRRKRAPTMASRSTKAPTGNSSAPSMAGGPTEATSAADDA